MTAVMEHSTVMDVLHQSAVFAGLSVAQLAEISVLAEEVRFAAGTTVIEAGTQAQALTLLASGHVQVYAQRELCPDCIGLVSLHKPGQLIGWSGLLGPNTNTATAVCKSACDVIVIDGAALEDLLAQDCALGYTVMRQMAETISERLRYIQQFVLPAL